MKWLVYAKLPSGNSTPGCPVIADTEDAAIEIGRPVLVRWGAEPLERSGRKVEIGEGDWIFKAELR